MKNTLVFLLPILALAVVASAVSAQTAAVNNSGTSMLIVDPLTCKVVNACAFAPTQTTRGHTIGFDGAVYASWWTVNGLGRLDLSTCKWTTVCRDTTNAIAGAPYQPVVNNEAIGGPGFWCVDGNAPPSPCPANCRNTFLTDLNGPCVLDCCFPNTFTPMSDAYAHPFMCGLFIGVGYSTSDKTISMYPLAVKPGSCYSSMRMCTLAYGCHFDALLHEDCRLYCWSNSTAFTGFEVVDLQTWKCTLCKVTGIKPTSGNAAVWNDPWELPGRLAHIVHDSDHMCYTVDLSSCPNAPVIKTGGPLPTGTYDTGREVEESQLTSWLTGPGSTRVFHLNFGPGAGGMNYALAPSLVCCARAPLKVGKLELWFQPDIFTQLGLLGALPYTAAGPLSRSGTAQVKWGLNQLGVCACWIAIAYNNLGVQDISNRIAVRM